MPRILSLPLLLGLTLTSLGRAQTAGTSPAFTIPRIEIPRHVMLGIDVLEAEGFAPLRGKRLGLLTQRAGVDSRGVSTVDILRGAPGLHLVALFATENGISGEVPSGKIYDDRIDPRTGLMVYSLYNGRTHQPTAKQLKGIDALVVDLQDIGTRSYTFTGAMKQAMEGCFANNVEIIVLDRPNPLGGLKVDGPMLDPLWIGPSLVNEFPVPYVHGLTIGELARLAKGQPGILRDKAGRAMPDAVRLNGRLTVIGMRGWRRNMRWSETGLRWIPTSPFIPDFSAVVGYPMTGLGCIMGEPGNIGGFTHGVGADYPFRGIGNKYVRSEVLEKELDALHLPGLQFRRVSVPSAKTGKPSTGLYIEVTDWDAWRPTELNFYLMKLDCKYSPHNPFAAASPASVSHFLKEMGSMAFYRLLVAHGANVDVDTTFRQWEAQAKTFQDQSRRYWLYN